MNSPLKRYERRQLLWPVVAFAVGTAVAVTPLRIGIAPGTAFTAWCFSLVLALVLPFNLTGARIGIFVTGLFLAVPCFVQSSPLNRCWLMCTMFLPFAMSTALVLTPPIRGIRSRLAYLCTWCGTNKVSSRKPTFDFSRLLQLTIATAIFAGALAVVKAVPASGPWLLLRWFAGGIGILAFAEMATACLPLIAAVFGLKVPLLMNSPYRSASIQEFWTQRWNVGASQKIFGPFFFKPLKRYGPWFALSAVFAISGVAHILIAFMALGRWKISLVFGVFFFVQPLLVAMERAFGTRHWPRALAHAWTLTALAITSPLIVEPVLQLIESASGPSENVLIPTAAGLGFLAFFSLVVTLGSLPAATKRAIDH